MKEALDKIASPPKVPEPKKEEDAPKIAEEPVKDAEESP